MQQKLLTFIGLGRRRHQNRSIIIMGGRGRVCGEHRAGSNLIETRGLGRSWPGRHTGWAKQTRSRHARELLAKRGDQTRRGRANNVDTRPREYKQTPTETNTNTHVHIKAHRHRYTHIKAHRHSTGTHMLTEIHLHAQGNHYQVLWKLPTKPCIFPPPIRNHGKSIKTTCHMRARRMERPPLKVTISAIQRISRQPRVPVEVLKFNNKKTSSSFCFGM